MLVVYAIDDFKSFESVECSFEQLQKVRDLIRIPGVIIVGNKSDLENREVTFEQGKQLAEKLGVKFAEVSAKSNSNVDIIRQFILNEVNSRWYTNYLQFEIPPLKITQFALNIPPHIRQNFFNYPILIMLLFSRNCLSKFDDFPQDVITHIFSFYIEVISPKDETKNQILHRFSFPKSFPIHYVTIKVSGDLTCKQLIRFLYHDYNFTSLLTGNEFVYIEGTPERYIDDTRLNQIVNIEEFEGVEIRNNRT